MNTLPKAFVINLDRDTERMQFMDAQLHELCIPYERFCAVDPREQDVSSEYSEELAIEKGKHALLPGELGCAISHKRTYEKFLESEVKYALILEDDVELPLNFKEILEKELENDKNKWEYLLFDYPEVGISFIKKWVRSITVNYREVKKKGISTSALFIFYSFLKALYILPLSVFEGWRNSLKKNNPGPVTFFRPIYFAGAYLITRKGAEKLLNLASPIKFTADKLPNQARIQNKLKFRVYAPLVVSQLKHRFGSSILNLSGEQIL